jgi:5-methylthioadenosine/S-adenosylhomocysteine deaminase
MRVSLGIVTRDQNIYVHGDNATLLATMPTDLAERIRSSTMGYAWPTEDVLAAFKRIYGEWEGFESRVHIILAPDWTPACSDELYMLNRRVADEYATAITTHVLETRSEMIFNLKQYGKPAMRRLADLGVLGPDVWLAHFVWASDEDISILCDTGAVAVNNPGSNLRLSTGISRVRDIMERGGNIAFGTDGISLSGEEDYLQELRLAALLQRTPGELTKGRMSSLALLRAMAVNGAQALHQTHLGSLGVGSKADLIALSRARLMWPPERFASTPVLDVVFDLANASHIDDVMIGGKLVLSKGHFTGIDESAVRASYEEVGRRLWAPSEEKERARRLVEETEPYMFAFYREWASVDVDPAYVYNATSTPTLESLP